MAVHTSSSNGRPRGNASAGFSLVAALAALATLAAAAAVAQASEEITLVEAGAAVPLAALFGLLALFLGRRGSRRAERTLGRAGGGRTARAGRLLGGVALYLAATAGIALGVYALLSASD